MRRTFQIFLLFQMVACSSKSIEYDYIKVFGIERAPKVTTYNKGLWITNYLFYNPKEDSVFLKYEQSTEDSFKYYTGNFKEYGYSDTISILASYLKYANGINSRAFIDWNREFNMSFYGTLIEYKDSKGVHYKVFDYENLSDSIIKTNLLIHRLESINWNRTTKNNAQFNEKLEIVNFLKGFGVYDSLLTPYISLPCVSGIDIKQLPGTWRSNGDRYNDATSKYWINRIDGVGNWVVERVKDGNKSLKFSGKIKSIKGNTILVESDLGTTTLKVLNLTENCFEYEVSNQTWRLDRMK